MATVYDANGAIIRKVKNLGWLIRNGKHVTNVQVLPSPNRSGEALLRVWFDPSGTPSGAYRYETLFGSVRLLWDWLADRRSLYHASLQWGTQPEGGVATMGVYPGPPDERSGYGKCPDGSASATGGQCCRCDRCTRARERYTL